MSIQHIFSDRDLRNAIRGSDNWNQVAIKLLLGSSNNTIKMMRDRAIVANIDFSKLDQEMEMRKLVPKEKWRNTATYRNGLKIKLWKKGLLPQKCSNCGAAAINGRYEHLKMIPLEEGYHGDDPSKYKIVCANCLIVLRML